MGHLGGLSLLIGLLTWFCAWGHLLPACHEQFQSRCSDGECIPRLSVCDGHTDCKDGSDEQSCDKLRCKTDEFACHNGRCVSLHALCDGEENCGDGSDETSCQNCSTFSCGPSDVCLSKNKLCDGQRDCKDGRDESQELCGFPGPHGQTSTSCASFEFPCGNDQCISRSWQCDGTTDCSDGSDEKNCDQDPCKVNNGGCSHKCLKLPMGFICTCPENMRLLRDSQCEEVDACLDRDVCDQLCVDMNGNLTCKCHKDYQMNRTTGGCQAKGYEALLAFTSFKGPRWKSITGSGVKELAQRSAGRGPVVALASNRTLYWAPQGRGAIYRVSMDGKPKESVLVLKVQGTVTGLALDWIHELLYWTSTESASVHVGLLDGSAQQPLITGLDRPSAVAVDPLHRLLFWAQCGTSAKIERVSLDGHDRKALVTYQIRHPIALSLDVPRQLLYWLDKGTKTISRVNLEGLHRKTVVESNGYLDRPFGLAVFEGFVYWSDEMTQSVCRADKRNGRNLQVLLLNASSPGGVAIVHPVLQPVEPTVCGHTGKVCHSKCVVDLWSKTPDFHCAPLEKGQNQLQEIPVISRTVPASTLSDPLFAGILSLIVFLGMLLVGIAVWWWREELAPPRPVTEQSFSLKESQDPLIIQEPRMDSNTCPKKETLLKLDLDGE